METGILYVVYNNWIKDPETNDMPYKIGITKKSVEDRYYGLGLKMPGKFETLFAYEFIDYENVEYIIHNICKKYRINGEWFKLNQSAIDIIKSNCEMMDGKPVTNKIKIKNETFLEKKQSENKPEGEKKYNINFGGLIEFIPDQETFRKMLLKYHKANWTIIYENGKIDKGIWNANNFNEKSSIINNIRSGYLRDWRKRGIIKGIFEVKEN